MKKRFLALAISTCLLLSGCSSKDIMLSYSSDSNSVTLAELDNGGESQLFAADLSVIPEGQDVGTDKKLTAESVLLVDTTTNEPVYADNIYQRMYPASITKIVTALVALKNGDLDDIVTISYNAANIKEEGAKLCGFKEGNTIAMRDLLSAFLVYSGNDAGVAIAEHVAGSVEKFADMMNEEAKALGAMDSHFVNPHGLHDDNHYTTAYDIYLFFNELVKNYGTFVDIISKGIVKIYYHGTDGSDASRTYTSTDRYLVGTQQAPEGVSVIGGKTGTTSLAGSCLVLYSEGENTHRYISVILKASSGDDLFTQMNDLLSKINRS
ncbi:MAG: D-alanyl-D-alanine carboxypeptidase [Clostridium sp.]|nr:D-alanyl-D-alanine carboxypeptidase [Clostridium sp.]